MFDIGIGEILVMAVVGLLIFGPDRLPRAAADAARTLRNVRAMASNARKDLADSAGVDLSDAQDALRDLQDLHPRNLAKSFLDGDDDADSGRSRRKSTGSSDEGASRSSTKESETTSARFDPDAT